jgi:phenylpropionate dioxygenase-like ring-hydroxylating dioxygenase large terminal subunit
VIQLIPNQWYSILESSEVGETPIGVTRMGEKLVLWRSKGKVSCIRDRCIHRGAALSGGKVVSGEIQCAFHGLRYDSTGKVTLIPANGKSTPIPDYFKVDGYTVKDEHGFIWLWWGKPRETYPETPWFEDIDEGFNYSTTTQHWATHYTRAVENQLDVAHLPFVHYNTIGRGNKTLVNGPYTTFENGTITVYPDNEVDEGQTPKKSEEIGSPPYDFYIQFKFPNIWQNRISDGYRIVVSFTPVDDENTMMYLRNYQKAIRLPGLSWIAGLFSNRGSSLIANQDRRVVITQIPKRVEINMGEKLIPADRPIAIYRRERDRLIKESPKVV